MHIPLIECRIWAVIVCHVPIPFWLWSSFVDTFWPNLCFPWFPWNCTLFCGTISWLALGVNEVLRVLPSIDSCLRCLEFHQVHYQCPYKSIIRINVSRIICSHEVYLLSWTHDLCMTCIIWFFIYLTDWLISSVLLKLVIGTIISITVPALYSRYEKHVDRFCGMLHRNFSRHYKVVDESFISKLPRSLSKDKNMWSWSWVQTSAKPSMPRAYFKI